MSAETLPPEARVGRMGLRVAHPERIANFYREVVGLVDIGKQGNRIDLGAGKHPLLTLHGDPGAPPRPREAAGLFHAAFLLPARKHLGAALERIRLVNALRGASDHGVSEALYFGDPEDNGLEMYWDRPREEWPRADDGSLRMYTDPLELSDLPSESRATEVPYRTRLGHVHLEVTDLERSLAFYRDTIGFNHHEFSYSSAAFLAAGDYHHHLGINTWNGRSEPVSGRGIAWFELALPGEQATADLRDRLTSADHVVDDIPNGFAVDDPDGITIRCVTR